MREGGRIVDLVVRTGHDVENKEGVEESSTTLECEESLKPKRRRCECDPGFITERGPQEQVSLLLLPWDAVDIPSALKSNRHTRQRGRSVTFF